MTTRLSCIETSLSDSEEEITERRSYAADWEDEEKLQEHIQMCDSMLKFDPKFTIPASWEQLYELPPRLIPPGAVVACPEPFMGTGVRALVEINKSRTVAIYGGYVSKKYDKDSHYVIKISRSTDFCYVDGIDSHGLGHLVNNSCDPNCLLADYIYKGHLMLCVISKRVIQPTEYLSVRYCQKEFDFIKICMCGSPKCKTRDAYLSFMTDYPQETITFF